MDISDIIAKLTPETEEALKPLDFLHNRSFVLPPPSLLPQEETGSPRTRETTPACSPQPGRAIVLTYSRLPYDGMQGFVFGSWDEKCDILLAAKPSTGGISRIHFRINFNWDSGCLTLIDMSSHGTRVDSTITSKTEDVRKSALPLGSGDRIQVGVVILRLEIPTGDGMDELRRLKWKAYKEEYLASVPKRNGIPQELSQPQTVMEEGRISLLHHRLGVGLRGKVRKAVDNKGNFYAVKIYRSEPDQRDSTEISTLGTLDHPHIIKVFPDKWMRPPKHALVMEYAEFGTLAGQGPISAATLAIAMSQIADAISYLHVRGITHRDVKPENILVISKTPLAVKLADFGHLGTAKTMSSFLGTPHFVSPDIWNARLRKASYSNHVDLWPIGVIILGYGFFYGLPTAPDFQTVDMNATVKAWLRWSRALPSAPCSVRPRWEDLVDYARRILRQPPSAAACTQQLLTFAETPTPTSSDNLKFLQSLESTPLSLQFVQIDMNSPLRYSLRFTELCRALKMSPEATKDALTKAAAGGGAGSENYVSFGYAAEVLSLYNGRALDEAMEIQALQDRIEGAHLACWPFESESVEK